MAPKQQTSRPQVPRRRSDPRPVREAPCLAPTHARFSADAGGILRGDTHRGLVSAAYARCCAKLYGIPDYLSRHGGGDIMTEQLAIIQRPGRCGSRLFRDFGACSSRFGQ
jgi:hypothetical protein